MLTKKLSLSTTVTNSSSKSGAANSRVVRLVLLFTVFIVLAISVFFVIIFATHNTLFDHEISSASNFQKTFVENKYHRISFEIPYEEGKGKVQSRSESRTLHSDSDTKLKTIAASELIKEKKNEAQEPLPLTVELAHNKPPSSMSIPTTASKASKPNLQESSKKDTSSLSSDYIPTILTKSSKKYHNLQCPNAELVQYWGKPTPADEAYKSPYFQSSGPETKYVTFEPDVGGWNNIRMQMELVLVFAFATGRTLVLPPDQPMYLLNQGKGHQKAHSFVDFFPFDYIKHRMEVITMEVFMEKEAASGHLRSLETGKVSLPPGNKTVFVGTEREDRLKMWDYLRNVSACPKWQCMTEYLVVPPAPGIDTTLLPPKQAKYYAKRRDRFAANRTANIYNEYWEHQKVIHFISKPGAGYRLLEHWYTYILFEDPFMDRYYKRFVRDYMHYTDQIFCLAALIIKEILKEGNGSYTAFHIRRGEFQYKVVKIPAENILHNIGDKIPKNQLVYLATDERNKTFFNAFKNHFSRVKYLDDYVALAGLKNINPNYLGMIDQVICTRGKYFIGTWFSTFTGYITRMRGYLGYEDKSVWYGDMEHRDRFQNPERPKFPFYMREWNNSWWQIDERK